MQIDSKEIKDILFKIKQDALLHLDRAGSKQVGYAIDARLSVIDSLLIWLNNSEKGGEIKMETLKLGELTKWEPKPRKGSIDTLIIEASKALKKNYDAVKVNVETVKWNSLANRTYKLREDKKIPENVVPRKNEDGTFLVYLDDPNPKRSKK